MRYINYAENTFSPLPEGVWNWYVNPLEFAGFLFLFFFSVLFLYPFPKIWILFLSHLNKRPVRINSSLQL